MEFSEVLPIKEQIIDVIKYSQEIDAPINIDQMFLDWFTNKAFYIKLFGDKLIYETDENIEIELNAEEKDKHLNNINDMIDNLHRSFPSEFPYRIQLRNFIAANKNGLYDNKVVTEWWSPDKTFLIEKGMKLTKSFRYFFTDKVILDSFQTFVSKIIQESKITGKLCLSVHPLDYLSVSENACNWRSCHALDGEYRAGNLAYMVDINTVVCYLKSGGNDYYLPHFPGNVKWNNKKWRMLLFFSDTYHDVMFAGRHYPFFSKVLMDRVKDEYLKLFIKKYKADNKYLYYYYSRDPKWTKWHDEVIENFQYKDPESDNDSFESSMIGTYYPVQRHIFKLKDVMNGDKDKDLFYNDLLYSSYYNPCYAWEEDSSKESLPYFSIGQHRILCPVCGSNYLTMHDSMLCERCEKIYGTYGECEECGDRCNRNDLVYLDNLDEWVCRNCLENNFVQCEYCGDWIPYDDVCYTENDVALCHDCYEAELDRED